ncbi:MAG: hypothetical protein KDC38_02030 [Planctomycetes bacterium]|nr:hypothetical protein [Planctomycetota bacterium]
MKSFTKDHARELSALLREAVAIVEDLAHTRPLAFKGYRGEAFLARAYAALEKTLAQSQGSASDRPCTQAEASYWQRIESLGDPEQRVSLR